MKSLNGAHELRVKKSASKKDALLNTALTLFNAHGYCAVGVDRIKDEAGVAKMTMYKYFPTKEALIEAVLGQRDENFRAELSQAVASATTPVDKLKSVFDWHAAWFRRADFHGCMFIKASEEFADAACAIRQACAAHKRWIQALLVQVLLDGGTVNARAQALAWHLLIVLEGLTVNANMFADAAQVEASWRYVAPLVNEVIAPS